MNATEVVSSPSRNVRNPATDANHFILTFENNRHASELFGQFEQNLKLLEQRLQIKASARGPICPVGTPGGKTAHLLERADLVTEMRQVRHPFREQGVRAQAGIEY